MYIKHIDIKSFGKIRNKAFSFDRGFNLIYGENESGKTTLFSFVKFIFYGIKQKKTPWDISFKERYIPWEYAVAEGSINFEYKGNDYFLKRYFSSLKSEIELYNISSGKKITENSILSDLGNYFFGVDVGSFNSTFFLSAASANFSHDSTPSLVSKLANIADSADENISYQFILEEIDTEISKLSSLKRKNALIPQYKHKISELNLKLHELNDIDSETQNTKGTLAQLLKEREDLENKTHNYNHTESRRKNNFLKTFLLIFLVMTILFGMFFFVSYPIHRIVSLIFLLGTFVALCILGVVEKQRKDFTTNVFNDKIRLEERINEIDVSINICKQNLKFLNESALKKQQLEDELEKVRKELAHCTKKFEAYTLAKRVLSMAHEDLRQCFLPKLTEYAGKIAGTLTSGKYSGVLIDEKLNLMVYTEDGFRDVMHLSKGAIEQVYLALRIALCRLIFKGFKCPLFLDDAFALYDKNRFLSSAQFLLEIASEQQILFSTCRESEYNFFKNADVNIINL